MNNMKFLLVICLFISLHLTSVSAQTLETTPYDSIHIGEGTPVFLEFGSKSCPSCSVMGKSLFHIQEKNPDYNIKYIDVYKDKQVIAKYNISAVPLQIIYDKDGNVVYENLGLIEEEELNELFKTYKF